MFNYFSFAVELKRLQEQVVLLSLASNI
jgi:hypothetical protein